MTVDISSAAILGSFVMILLSIIGTLVLRLLNRIDKSQEKTFELIGEMQKAQAAISERLIRLETKHESYHPDEPTSRAS